MSTENQNGSAGTQSNGIKTTIGWSSSTRTVTNNSSFLHTSNSMLNRDKPRQVPPPTLPKYTSSFNAGWNGSSGTAERLSRDREVGGSYRLASLDRLALRQRILDGEKPNGDTTSSLKISVDERFCHVPRDSVTQSSGLLKNQILYPRHAGGGYSSRHSRTPA
ncbi:hypothetical protein K0M31_015038 [Melipona bicolor]|uniref:Uncharacterized protein n=1 Tax=Melipona bicolor TaxID=60889 RepID=A0AA40FH08_9HYME|nr:hypothetical protein K0M31_015038 [Melipona bicolor]